jgi:hypothetical protein
MDTNPNMYKQMNSRFAYAAVNSSFADNFYWQDTGGFASMWLMGGEL